MADASGDIITVKICVVEAALAALKAGDGACHDYLVAQAARELTAVDAVVLGQFSLARAAPSVSAAGFNNRVITKPDAAVQALRQLVHSSA